MASPSPSALLDTWSIGQVSSDGHGALSDDALSLYFNNAVAGGNDVNGTFQSALLVAPLPQSASGPTAPPTMRHQSGAAGSASRGNARGDAWGGHEYGGGEDAGGSNNGLSVAEGGAMEMSDDNMWALLRHPFGPDADASGTGPLALYNLSIEEEADLRLTPERVADLLFADPDPSTYGWADFICEAAAADPTPALAFVPAPLAAGEASRAAALQSSQPDGCSARAARRRRGGRQAVEGEVAARRGPQRGSKTRVLEAWQGGALRCLRRRL
jgi:hypothetical protein